jgi:hypothetical protein
MPPLRVVAVDALPMRLPVTVPANGPWKLPVPVTLILLVPDATISPVDTAIEPKPADPCGIDTCIT